MVIPGSAESRRRGGVSSRSARGRAFTLLEVILALFLMILLLSGVYSFYATVLRARAEGGRIARDAMLTRALLERIAAELRHAADVVPGDGIGFRGEKDSITIVRTRMPELYAFDEFDLIRDEPPPAQMDIERIRYELLWDEELEDEEGVLLCHGLWRTVQKTFDPNPRFVVKEAEAGEGEDENEDRIAAPRAEGELIAPEIKYVRFAYFDGAEWRDQWQVVDEEGGLDMGQAAASGQGSYALPQAVTFFLTGPQRRSLFARLNEVARDRSEALVRLLQLDEA